ncbi:hypothetical protein FQZ97_645290 [compost metagenome]
MPVSPNGSNCSSFITVAVLSRPRRSSPKLPARLTVERRVKFDTPVAPSSFVIGASSQKLADRPPPRSSTPRKPRRLELRPEFASSVRLAFTL